MINSSVPANPASRYCGYPLALQTLNSYSHGDTDTRTHQTLPNLAKTRTRGPASDRPHLGAGHPPSPRSDHSVSRRPGSDTGTDRSRRRVTSYRKMAPQGRSAHLRYNPLLLSGFWDALDGGHGRLPRDEPPRIVVGRASSLLIPKSGSNSIRS